MPPDDKTRIGTLQVRSMGENGPAVRRVLSNLLNSIDLRPAGVPPSAVLIVRRMADPMPRRIVPYGPAVRVDAAWERAARDALASLYRQAARPGQHSVPANAEAVLFVDEGEMLASLAVDLVQGEARGRWWWRAVLRTLPSASSEGLTALLCSRAMAVPAALHQLARQGQAIMVVEALSPHQALAILFAVGRAYGIADFRLGWTYSRAPSDPQGHGPPQVQETGDGENVPVGNPRNAQAFHGMSGPATSTHLPTGTGAVAAEIAPWSTTLVPPRLGKEQACLVGVGLSLYEQPSVVRTVAFLRSLRAWWAAPMAQLDRNQVVLQVGSMSARALKPRETAPVLLPTVLAAREPEKPAEPDVIDRTSGSRGQDSAEPGVAQSREKRGQSEEIQDPASQSNHDTIPAQERQAVIRQELAWRLAGGLDTDLGGVLYLINLVRHLDLPACFEDNWGLNSQVGPWGVLEVLGRGLLTGTDTDLGLDPLWVALAQLAGREPGELPGEAFSSSDRFELPGHWLVPVGNEAGNVFHWATDRQRLRLWSAQGYLLVDWPRDTSVPEIQAREAARAYLNEADRERGPFAPIRSLSDQAPIDSLTSPLVEDLNVNLARWLALVLPYIRFRLQHALTQGSSEEYDLERGLLRHQGRLYVTSTHVDLVMRLDDISLPARLAGLDCNPGWMADFGRVVLFHFE